MRSGNLDRLDLSTMAAPPPHGCTGSQQQQPEDSPKKIRKPYTITKSRESWTDQEHEKFLEALQLFDRDWKKIESFVGTKTVIQIRSHAQKYFLKAQKNGTGEHVPPPRPKRRSSQPYPQKAFKAGFSTSEPGPFATKNHINNSCSSAVSSGGWPQDKLLHGSKGDQSLPLKGTPDFAKVYQFIGRVFDPDASCHLETLGELSPINRETVMLLLKNLVMNISSPDFQEHKILLSNSYATTTKSKPNTGIEANGYNSISCTRSQPTANLGSTSISGEQGLKQPNVDDNVLEFKSGSVPIIFHVPSTDSQLQSPTHQQFSNDNEGMADIMSLPPLILESPPLPQLVNSDPWSSDKNPWGSSPTRSFCSIPAIS